MQHAPRAAAYKALRRALPLPATVGSIVRAAAALLACVSACQRELGQLPPAGQRAVALLRLPYCGSAAEGRARESASMSAGPPAQSLLQPKTARMVAAAPVRLSTSKPSSLPCSSGGSPLPPNSRCCSSPTMCCLLGQREAGVAAGVGVRRHRQRHCVATHQQGLPI